MLREAIAYLAETVPKAEQSHPKILAAAEILTRAAERENAGCFSRAWPRCRRSSATKHAYSTPIGKTGVGASASSSGMNEVAAPR
jgi:hypothetical protein